MVLGHSKSRPSLVGPLTLVAVVTFVVGLAGVNARATYGAQVTSDEPQYLLTALSLGEDLNLDISDELADERFLDFHEIPLNPQTIALDDSGQRLSPHDPGLPLLLALPMRLGGWQAAKVALAAMAAAAAAATAWVCVRRFDVGVATSAMVTTAMFASPPLTGYATQVYPEMPAALVTIIGVAALTGSRIRGGGLSTRAIAVAVAAIIALPWLAVKYVPVAAVLALALLAGLAPEASGLADRFRRAAAVLGVLVVSGGLYLLIHQRIYGGWTVYATGDHFVDGEFLVVGSDPNYLGRSERLLALLTDRAFGLIAWAPAYALAIPGMAVLFRRRPPNWLLLTGLIGAGWAVATWVALTMHGWWWPGRQVVVILPVVVVVLTVFADNNRWIRRSLVGLSGLAVTNWLWLVVEATTDRRTLIVDFTETASPVYRLWSPLLPDFRRGATLDVILAAVWAVAFGCAAALAWRDAGAPPNAARQDANPSESLASQAADAATD